MFLTFTSLSSKQIIKILGGESGQKKSMRYCMIFGNVAFLGYPICYAFFGEIGMFYASIYVVTQNLFQWTLGVNIFKQEKIRLSNLKKLMNPGIIAITIGLSMFFFNIRTPMIMERIIKGIGGTAVPLALMMIGATLQQYKFSEIASDKRIYIIAALKTLVFPVIFLSILYFIPMNRMLKSILTIQAAAPVQATSVVFAKNFNGDSVVPAKVVFLSVILCLVTVPLFLVLINI
ncbi:MAG: malate permease [Clostridiales bacterium]|nr:malate permease [Clostridiales bacterium]